MAPSEVRLMESRRILVRGAKEKALQQVTHSATARRRRNWKNCTRSSPSGSGVKECAAWDETLRRVGADHRWKKDFPSDFDRHSQ
jgi:hypothetical protein